MSGTAQRWEPSDVWKALGSGDDPIIEVERRARRVLRGRRIIVWEGDAQTFQFSHVGADAEVLLGYAVERWTTEPTFWADHVVHDEDRDEAIAYCALATGRKQNHEFEYRARTREGSVVWLYDVVTVVVGPRGIPVRLRGIMIDITEDKRLDGTVDGLSLIHI